MPYSSPSYRSLVNSLENQYKIPRAVNFHTILGKLGYMEIQAENLAFPANFTNKDLDDVDAFMKKIEQLSEEVRTQMDVDFIGYILSGETYTQLKEQCDKIGFSVPRFTKIADGELLLKTYTDNIVWKVQYQCEEAEKQTKELENKLALIEANAKQTEEDKKTLIETHEQEKKKLNEENDNLVKIHQNKMAENQKEKDELSKRNQALEERQKALEAKHARDQQSWDAQVNQLKTEHATSASALSKKVDQLTVEKSQVESDYTKFRESLTNLLKSTEKKQ